MAKKVINTLKLNLPAGAATPAPPVGPILGQAGINMMEFIKQYNDRTADKRGETIPAEITVYQDRSFNFICKKPPVSFLLKEAAKVEKGSAEPNKSKVAKISRDKVKQIAETKMPDLNANDIENAIKIVEGTARSMGIEVE